MRILVVDDEERQRVLLTEYLNNAGHAARGAENGEEALKSLSLEGAEAAFVDMRMPRMDGLAFIKNSLELYPDLAIVVMTAYGTVESAVEAMKAGAFDYLLKPVDLEHIDILISKIDEKQKLITENRYLKRKLEQGGMPEGIIGKSQAIRKVLADVNRIARSDATVLIRGESGTGKELVANAIHDASPRAGGPFLAVNCASLPETLLEAELFGHEKGAFTGAVSRRLGRFELAHKGTIFLDEIGDMPGSVQVKLLRTLESRKIQRLGSGADIAVDIRILAATNRDLEKRIKEGGFREDLFYRLNVIPISIPPLRERREDILLLTEHFIEKYSRKNNKAVRGITPDAKDLLLNYSWPGNVRELENLIERAIVLTPGDVIDIKDLDPFIFTRAQSAGTGFDDLNLEHLEKLAIIEALKRTDGSLSKAADMLGIHRNSIRLKINKYDIRN
jgi:DNA-binding NtrC family response regulator